MNANYTVTVPCPRCSTEMEIGVDVSGAYIPATRWEPAEDVEVEHDAPEGCTHDAPEDDQNDAIVGGPYTPAEQKELDAAIRNALAGAQQESREFWGQFKRGLPLPAEGCY